MWTHPWVSLTIHFFFSLLSLEKSYSVSQTFVHWEDPRAVPSTISLEHMNISKCPLATLMELSSDSTPLKPSSASLPSVLFPLLFHSSRCLTLYFENLSLLTFFAFCPLPSSQSLGLAVSSFSGSYKPAPPHCTSQPCHLKCNSSPRLKLVPYQRQVHLQSLIQCLYMVGNPQMMFIKLTCSKQYSSKFRKKLCTSPCLQEQSFHLRCDFYLFPENKATSVCSCCSPLLIKSLSSL